MPRVLQPETAALLDQVAAARNALPRLMRLHRERIGGLRKLDPGPAKIAIDEPLQRDLAGSLIRAPGEARDETLNLDILDRLGVPEQPGRLLDEGDSVAAQENPRGRRVAARPGARPGDPHLQALGRADSRQAGHGVAEVGGDAELHCLPEGFHAAGRRRLASSLFECRKALGKGARHLALKGIGHVVAERQLGL